MTIKSSLSYFVLSRIFFFHRYIPFVIAACVFCKYERRMNAIVITLHQEHLSITFLNNVHIIEHIFCTAMVVSLIQEAFKARPNSSKCYC